MSGLSFIDERILQAHANDEIVREFFSGHVWIVRWRDRGKRGHRDPAYRYTLFVNGILESIGEFSERAAVHAARANRAFLLQRDGVR